MDFPNTKLTFIEQPDISNKLVLDIVERYMTYRKRDAIRVRDLEFMIEELEELVNA